ncbi:uncharacterized protein TNCV_4023691 [Trichonephila clavipes]|nr:uncharacterized protein TNCV_4023691 [Trichonephila clavipes]
MTHFEPLLDDRVNTRVGTPLICLTSRFLFRTFFTCRNCGGGDRGRVAIYRPFGEVSLSLNRTVTCMVLKANDRRTSCPCHDEFHGPRSDYVRQSLRASQILHVVVARTVFGRHWQGAQLMFEMMSDVRTSTQ